MKGRGISLVLLLLAALASAFLLAYLSLAGGMESVTLNEYLPTPRPSEPCDVCEPNNWFTEPCGPLAPGKGYQYFIHCTNNLEDLYYIDLEIPGTVTLSLTHIPPNADYDIYLYDENENPKCHSNQPGNSDERVTCNLSQPGRYYVRVCPWERCCNDDAPYTLMVDYPTPPSSPTPIPTMQRPY
jgi:hypothetical protein